MSDRSIRLAAALAVFVVPACTSVPTFPTYGLDAGYECDESGGCDTGEVCVQHRCYRECSTGGCAPGEACTDGVCMTFVGDAGRDAGRDAPPPDVPPDPCDLIECTTAPFLSCYAGVCVVCLDSSQCGAALGGNICDLSRGTCGTGDIANPLCAPCASDADCAAGTCETISGDGWIERVCLPATDPCPPGMRIGAGDTFCHPSFGESCRAYRSAAARMPCAMSSDCDALGSTETILCPTAICTFPCGSDVDCPTGAAGACDVASGYCF